MIELLILRSDTQDYAAHGYKEPLGRAFAIRDCNLISLQASLQRVEVYNAANTLVSWAEEDAYDGRTYHRVAPAALEAISSNWHLCKARSRWHRSSILGVEERKHVLYLVPCNHPALAAAAPPTSTGWWPSSPASPSSPAATYSTIRRRRTNGNMAPQDQSQHPCVTQLGTGRCIIENQPVEYILDWMRSAHKIWQHHIVQQGQGYYCAKYKLQLLVVTDQLCLQPMPQSLLGGPGAAAAAVAGGARGISNSTTHVSRSSEDVIAAAAADIANGSSNSSSRGSIVAGTSLGSSSSHTSSSWPLPLARPACTALCVAVSWVGAIAHAQDGSSWCLGGFQHVLRRVAVLVAVDLAIRLPLTIIHRIIGKAGSGVLGSRSFAGRSSADNSCLLSGQPLQQHASREQVDSLSTCVVCLDATRSVMLLPCKHLVLCDGCSQQVLSQGDTKGSGSRWGRRGRRAPACCPVCRRHVEGHVSGVILS